MHIQELFKLFGASFDIQDLFSIAIFFIQFTALYFSFKLMKFSAIYSKRWSSAWAVFSAAMVLALFRRGLVIAWGFGLDGSLGIILRWTNDYVMNFIFSVIWVIFLAILWGWWHKFFKTYFDGKGKIKIIGIKKRRTKKGIKC